MNKKSIAFFCPSQSWGGLEMNVLRIADWMKNAGVRMFLYADPNSRLHSEAVKSGLDVIPFLSENKFEDVKNVLKLKKSLRQNGIDVIVFHLNRNFPLLALTKQFLKNSIKTIYMQHMQLGTDKKDFLHNYMYGKLDSWIAPLQMFQDSLIQHTSIPKSKISVIPFGIELDRFTGNRMTREEARNFLNLPQDRTIIGFVGRIDPKKCQHTLIEAAGILHQQGHDIDILLVGDKSKDEHDQYVVKINTMINRYNLNEKVFLREHFEEIETAYKAIDIFTLTSSAETFGMVTIEAMASGLPVIGTNSGGTPEIIDESKTGLLFEPENAEDLASKVIELLDSKEKAEELSKAAQSSACSRFSNSTQIEKLIHLFNKL